MNLMVVNWQLYEIEGGGILECLEYNYFYETSSPQASGWGWCGDDGAVGNRFGGDRLLDQAGEAVADFLGGGAIEAEDVPVEVRRRCFLPTAP